MLLIKKTTLPADALYKLAFSPKLDLCEKVKKSIDENGWLADYPLNLYFETGSFIKIDGHHRLSYLESINRLNTLIPCDIYLL